MTHAPRVAALPPAVREDLNRRLHEGASDTEVLDWLDRLPKKPSARSPKPERARVEAEEVRAWRETGYRDWLAQREALDQARHLAAEVAELKQAVEEPMTENLARWLAAQYVVVSRAAARLAGSNPVDLKTLRVLCADVVALRRGDHYAERLRLDQERLELERQQSQRRLEELFWAWAQQPENKSKICQSGLTEAEKAARIREIFRYAPEPDEAEELCEPAAYI